jgi:hypothetical protein
LRNHQPKIVPTPCGPIVGPRFDTEDGDNGNKFAKDETEPIKQVTKTYDTPQHNANKPNTPIALSALISIKLYLSLFINPAPSSQLAGKKFKDAPATPDSRSKK